MVQLEYELQLADATERRTLPFVVGVIADLRGDPEELPPRLRDRRFVSVDRSNFDHVLRSLKPRVAITVPNHLGPEAEELQVHVDFRSMDDFQPDALARRIAPLAERLDRRRALAELRDLFRAKPAVADATLAAVAALDPALASEVDRMRPSGQSEDEALAPLEQALPPALKKHLGVLSSGAAYVVRLLLELLGGRRIRTGSELTDAVVARVMELDSELAAQVTEILHHSAFQRLEAAWRGLEYLLTRGFDNPTAKCYVLSARADEIFADFRCSPRYDHAWLFRRLKEELQVFGGAPYSVVLVDHLFSRLPDDIELLQELARVGLALDVVFAGGVSPEMFGFDELGDLDRPRDLAKIFETIEYAGWRYLRGMEASRHLALALPRVVARRPYQQSDADGAAFNYAEQVSASHADWLWMNAAYPLVHLIREAFGVHGWFGALRGVDGGGLVEGLPVHPVLTPEGELDLYCPTETDISDRREAELARLGFMPLVHCKGADYAAFFSTMSVCKPRQWYSDVETIRDTQLCDLRVVLSLGLIVRFMLVIARDWGGGGRSPEELDTTLRAWLLRLLERRPSHTAAPLLAHGEVTVSGEGPYPGNWRLVVSLQPALQFETLAGPFRLELDLGTLLDQA